LFEERPPVLSEPCGAELSAGRERVAPGPAREHLERRHRRRGAAVSAPARAVHEGSGGRVMNSIQGTAPIDRRHAERWEQEAAFFDRQAARVGDMTLPIDPLAFRRYTRPVPRRRFNKEFRFRIIGNVEGKRLLDVGCGDGPNMAMFARMGADVTGIDVSPGALDVAHRRAEANGVADSVHLVCSPIETADLPDGSVV